MSLTKREQELCTEVARSGYDADKLNANGVRTAIASLQRDLGKVRKAMRAREDDTDRLRAAQNALMHHISRLTQRLPAKGEP